MSYGDSANWDGEVGGTLSSYILIWRVEWRCRDGVDRGLPCTLRFEAGQHEGEVAISVAGRLAAAWNDQNQHGRRAIYDPAKPNQIRWDNNPIAMKFKCYIDGGTPPTSFTLVPYGNMQIIYPPWDLKVFSA